MATVYCKLLSNHGLCHYHLLSEVIVGVASVSQLEPGCAAHTDQAVLCTLPLSCAFMLLHTLGTSEKRTFLRQAEVLPLPLLERQAGNKSLASLKTLPYSGFCNILYFQASEAQSIKAGRKVNQNSDVPKYSLEQQHPREERARSRTGRWTRGSPPSFLSSKVGG